MSGVSVPRRLSVSDPDYDPSIGERLTVRLDGVDQHGRAEAYDLDAQTVTRCKHDAAGKIYLDGDIIAMEMVGGVVTVEWRA
ncbi:MAG: hypothetical protein PGN16_08440 [Sphingomonas phyllosphaerae]|uniref:hypothetical protein n=1 Tax=Sphingomonas phyllosphaerae TaxID=257003 RepID=UPI002FFC73FA